MLFSFAAMSLGFEPAWIASTPSIARSIWAHSASLTRLRRFAWSICRWGVAVAGMMLVAWMMEVGVLVNWLGV